jgi:hypothetical protein
MFVYIYFKTLKRFDVFVFISRRLKSWAEFKRDGLDRTLIIINKEVYDFGFIADAYWGSPGTETSGNEYPGA